MYATTERKTHEPSPAAARSRDRPSRRPQGPWRGRWGRRRARRDQHRRSREGRSPPSWGRRGRARARSCTWRRGWTVLRPARVALGDTELAGLSERRLTILRRERIGFVFQAFNLMPSLTVTQNIGLPLRLDGRRPRRSEVREVAARVGLDQRLRHRPSQLSGGQQQRVAIARALITRPGGGVRRRADRSAGHAAPGVTCSHSCARSSTRTATPS